MTDSAGESPDAAVNTIQLLETKFYIPRRGAALVSRPRLIERIREGARHRLTIISAPAGFGKTTLLADWLAESGAERTAAWVSLDPTENDATVFCAYVTRALQRVHSSVGRHALSLLHDDQLPPVESVLTSLLNDINAADSDFTLILDDYHVIDAPSVHGALAFLVDHLPTRMHVVVASRSDVPLPLPRLRVRGELTELLPADMRFTFDEASAFLNQVMDLDLSAIDTATLEQRTEGWIAALKLAAVSMKGRSDTRRFVDAFSGDNRHIADYLVEEVLQREPERIRHFLLATAILDRLGGPLCDAVTGEKGSQALLDGLERRNLFLVALDDKREWYRYHHLFADVLQAHATREDPERVHACHRRASEWYALHGSPEDAVRHAIAAKDFDRAAGILEPRWPTMDRSWQGRRWLERVKALPDAIVRARPVLSMGYAWALMNVGELEAVETRLRDVERWLDANRDSTTRPAEMVVTDEARFFTLATELIPARAYLAGSLGNTSGTVAQAQRALDVVPEGDLPKRVVATALLALAQWANGDLEPAHDTFSDALAGMLEGGDPLSNIRGMFVLGDIRAVQGRLHDAHRAYEKGLRRAEEHISAVPPETDELHLGMSELHRERGDIDAAIARLMTLTESAGRTEHVGNRQRWCTSMSRIREVQGNLAGALHLLVEAEGVDVRSPLPRPRPFAAMKARVWIVQGELGDALRWVSERGLTVNDDLSYMREFEHITLARLLIARPAAGGHEHFLRDAVQLLARLTTAAEAGGRTGAVIETLVLQAVAHQALGDMRAARDPIERAMQLAEPEGFLRTFLDEGNRMRDLLKHAVTRGFASDYARRVLAAFDAPPPALATIRIIPTESLSLLTTRELVILRLIAAGMRNQDIATHLSISPATVKRHIANTYGKLDVKHRTEALVRANELKLL